jgi:hypothetical protein
VTYNTQEEETARSRVLGHTRSGKSGDDNPVALDKNGLVRGAAQSKGVTQ